MPTNLTGVRIRERRRSLGIKQTELAARVGVSPSYLNLIEHNKRGIAGGLLGAIGEELGLSMEELQGAAEQRLFSELAEIAADPILGDPAIGSNQISEFIGRHPQWAGVLTRVRRRLNTTEAEAEAMSDRLAHDPVLAEAVHAMLTEISVLRSTADILADVEDIEPDQRRRFLTNVAHQATLLSDTGASLAAFFDEKVEERRVRSPINDLEDFIGVSQGRFPALEEAASGLRAKIAPHGADLLQALMSALGQSSGAAGRNAQITELAAKLVEDRLNPDIERELEGARELADDASRDLARLTLIRLSADALILPADEFENAVEAVRWDIDKLLAMQDGQIGLVFRRLAAGSRKRVAYMAADLSGRTLVRMGALELLPRQRDAACPKWALHKTGRDGADTITQVARFSDEANRLFLAALDRREGVSHMIALDADDLKESVHEALAEAPSEAVGATCHLCAHRGCDLRRENPVVDWAGSALQES